MAEPEARRRVLIDALIATSEISEFIFIKRGFAETCIHAYVDVDAIVHRIIDLCFV
ncbi:hypothetical protein [Rhizobium aouanii]|uniref:DUF86 domain-containing protein n=1 Tax=Rhizobium aouanii TaxID=3118145 RepID=A0ABU8CLQ4_9HYPH